jgi:tetrapyrrole methylase family protein/MazG family protein
MARLRAPGGCPWDAQQTHASLAKHLLEETHEVLDAIDSGDPARLRDELGDVLLQVVFHSELAREAGEYDIDDVARGTVDKLVRRHPHVFGDVHVDDASEVLVNWEKIKTEEEGKSQELEDDIPATLPSLARAAKVQRRAAGWGFEWRTTDAAMAKLREEVDELAAASPGEAEAELGDVLFATAAVARTLGVDPESALRRTTTRFADRFERMRGLADERGLDMESMSDQELLAFFRESRDEEA